MAEKQHTGRALKSRAKGGKAAPGGDRIAVAVGALVYEKMFGGAAAPTKAPAGSILRGLTDLIGKLKAGGVAVQVNSWIGPGANQPIQPEELGSALGQTSLNELSQRTGMNQEQLLSRLATVLPQLINHLTPNGRMPSLADLKKKMASADLPDADFLDEMRSTMSEISNSTSETNLKGRAGYLVDVSSLLGGSKILGSWITSELEAHELLHRGLPRAALSNLVDNLHVIQVDEATEAMGMSLRTLQRHKNTPAEHLDVQQSGRAWKFAEILAKATHVLGSQEEAEQWLKRPAIGLNRQRPIDLLTTPAGAKLVETYLGRLEYGVYT
jgi:putative toxin-antitoxin system antitoxin component (TIGR02293 family)